RSGLGTGRGGELRRTSRYGALGNDDARLVASRRASMRSLAVGLAGDGCMLLLEAAAAIDGTVQSRDERYGGVLAAASAGDRRHLAATGGAITTAVDAAGVAALRLVQEPFLQIKPLLAGGEDERPTAIATRERLILECHRRILLGTSLGCCGCRPDALV